MRARRGVRPLIATAAAVLSPASDRVFVSYCRSDERAVHAFARFLRAANVRVFLDVDDIAYGEKWKDAIRAALEECTSIFVFWSHAAAASEQVRAEYETAVTVHTGIRVIPILMDATPLPEPLAGFNGLPLQFVLAQAGAVHGARHGAALFAGAVAAAFAVGAAVGPLEIAGRYVHHPAAAIATAHPATRSHEPDAGLTIATTRHADTVEFPEDLPEAGSHALGPMGTGRGYGTGGGHLAGSARLDPSPAAHVPEPMRVERAPQLRLWRVMIDGLLLLFPFALVAIWTRSRRRAARRKLARIVAEAGAR